MYSLAPYKQNTPQLRPGHSGYYCTARDLYYCTTCMGHPAECEVPIYSHPTESFKCCECSRWFAGLLRRPDEEDEEEEDDERFQ